MLPRSHDRQRDGSVGDCVAGGAHRLRHIRAFPSIQQVSQLSQTLSGIGRSVQVAGSIGRSGKV